MRKKWLFASGSRMVECFQEMLFVYATGEAVREAVMRKLALIQRRPERARHQRAFGDQTIYVVPTGPSRDVPPLLIAYLLDRTERVIYMMGVFPAAGVQLRPDDSPFVYRRERGDGAPRPEPLERVLERVLRRVARTRWH
jgi:hypothetical protein